MDAVGVRYSSSVPSIILMAWPPMQTVWMRVAVLLARNGGRKLEKGNLKMGKRKGRNSKIEVEKGQLENRNSPETQLDVSRHEGEWISFYREE
jgi:hypothetical protein